MTGDGCHRPGPEVRPECDLRPGMLTVGLAGRLLPVASLYRQDTEQ